VYDFDNTLYRGESGVDLFFYYIKKRPSLLRFTPTVIVGVIRYKLHLVQLDDVLNGYGSIVERFVAGVEDFAQDAKEFWDRHDHRLRSFYYRLQQDDDLVISASPEPSLQEVCGRLGVKRWIGTRINEETRRLDYVCFRENKVKAFQEQYPGETIENFFTDSMNDKPLMELAQKVFLIQKGKMKRIK
jgi:phosphoserine phosphatase